MTYTWVWKINLIREAGDSPDRAIPGLVVYIYNYNIYIVTYIIPVCVSTTDAADFDLESIWRRTWTSPSAKSSVPLSAKALGGGVNLFIKCSRFFRAASLSGCRLAVTTPTGWITAINATTKTCLVRTFVCNILPYTYISTCQVL